MSTLLSENIEDQEQCSGRPCLIIEGLNNVDEDNKNLSQEIVDIVRNELDVKISIDDIGKSFPTIKNKEHKTNQPIKIKASPTGQRQKPLGYATEVTDNYNLINFVYTDINHNFKIRLRNPIKNRVVFSFDKKTKLAEILGLIDHFEYHTKFREADNQTNCEDE